MAEINDKFTESVNGTVIGEITFQGALFYDGIKQGTTIYGYNHDEVIEKSKTKLQEIKTELNESFTLIYPKQLWEIRIY